MQRVTGSAARASRVAVPAGLTAASEAEVGRLVEFLHAHPKTVVVTGAGMSTSSPSNIPDYRSNLSKPYTPMQMAQFAGSSAARQRYWMRSFVGYPAIRDAQPNVAHGAMAGLLERGFLSSIITQNVDSLHQKAGASEEHVIELHGTLREVVCLECEHRMARDVVQESMARENPWWAAWAERKRANAADEEEMQRTRRPDGDAELPADAVKGFRSPTCPRCRGDMVKPTVVFFGDHVPRATSARAMDVLENRSDALLVVGSSLHTFSGYRFALKARDFGMPLFIVSHGETRADHLVDRPENKIARSISSVFSQLESILHL